MAGQTQSNPQIWLSHLGFLSDDYHRRMVYEMVFGSNHGANIFHETRRRCYKDKVVYSTNRAGQPDSYVISRPVTHFPRLAGQKEAEKIQRYEYDDQREFPTKANTLSSPTGTGMKKRKNNRPVGYVPQIVTREGVLKGERLQLRTSSYTLQWASIIGNQIHSWARSGVFSFVGDKRVEQSHGLDWRELGLSWLNFVIEPKKPRLVYFINFLVYFIFV